MPIEFEEENISSSRFTSRTVFGTPTTPKMVRAILKTGIVKNEKQAGFVLLTISIISFALAIYISYAFVFNQNTAQKLTPEQEVQRQEFLNRIKAGQLPLPPASAQ